MTCPYCMIIASCLDPGCSPSSLLDPSRQRSHSLQPCWLHGRKRNTHQKPLPIGTSVTFAHISLVKRSWILRKLTTGGRTSQLRHLYLAIFPPVTCLLPRRRKPIYSCHQEAQLLAALSLQPRRDPVWGTCRTECKLWLRPERKTLTLKPVYFNSFSFSVLMQVLCF